MKQILNEIFSLKKYLLRLILPLLMVVLGASVFVSPALATGVYQIPNLSGSNWVLDQSDIISRVNEGKINSTFEDLAKKTGNEVRFVTIRRLDYGETPESFSQELFEKWFPTPAEQANQTLLVLDTVTNGTAIVTGEEVKPLLTDSIAESVVSETMGIPIRDGNKYNQAFVDASDRLLAVLSGEPDPGPPEVIDTVQVEGTFTKAEDTDQGNATAWVVGLLIAATVIPMATYFVYQVNQPSSDG
ncbi:MULTISPECIES: photosystem II repair protein Psb32 [Cyanophyceae]|uniref:Beta-propeller domain-containing protein, methanol dehydrogenase n=1 Tax=Nodularia spumigena CENA596 TaxID=1819295 RepID=A0A166K6A4_NODSP|nr:MULTISPECIES: TPM domain-containing protein [Cyanophyceae]MDB9356126.1 TPM domain-containing protein [Nodularia spumigena CS-587/03]KZL50636.1 beta-propeller domain-containing protein, methanol dehydrogenase [Nodularia spumigena CENA596]MDB9304118.1 TPM domain-containing protein [Nodularia spumigena CS-591/12]MDB9318650.1 TPM domain-containing protein [Nodularia spumigena CS-590/01A]MDB9324249.1 TPM domain-containing protein [Nodularia spumigena CS-591/07A]